MAIGWLVKKFTAAGASQVANSVGDASLKIRQAITGDVSPEDKAKIELALNELDKTVVNAVNTTMQAEAKSEHWMQWAWRPTVGFTFAATIINNYILLPYLKNFGLAPIEIPSGIWQAMLIVLGVAAGTRGLEKWEKRKKGD